MGFDKPVGRGIRRIPGTGHIKLLKNLGGNVGVHGVSTDNVPVAQPFGIELCQTLFLNSTKPLVSHEPTDFQSRMFQLQFARTVHARRFKPGRLRAH